MKTLIIIMVASLLLSCDKQDVQSEISFTFIKGPFDNCQLTATKAIIETDKGFFESSLTPINNGYQSNVLSVQPDTYKLIAIELMDYNGKTINYVQKDGPKKDGSSVTWLNNYDYDFTNDQKLMFQIFCE